MIEVNIQLEPLTKEAFEPYGDVIETEGANHFPINAGSIERFHDLARLDIDTEAGGRAIVSIAVCNDPGVLPYQLSLVERHPHGSQAFIPMSPTRMAIVVAPAGEHPAPTELKGFISNGRQGINYRAGVWHMPLISDTEGQQFLVVDRAGKGHNCDELKFDNHVITVSE